MGLGRYLVGGGVITNGGRRNEGRRVPIVAETVAPNEVRRTKGKFRCSVSDMFFLRTGETEFVKHVVKTLTDETQGPNLIGEIMYGPVFEHKRCL